MDQQKAGALLLSQQNQQYEQENKKLNDKVYEAATELEHAYQKCDRYAQQIQELQVELKHVVAKEEYDRVKLAYDQLTNDFFTTKEHFQRLEDKATALFKEKGELDIERKRLFENIVRLEQQLNDKERDLELKDVKIESLENII